MVGLCTNQGGLDCSKSLILFSCCVVVLLPVLFILCLLQSQTNEALSTVLAHDKDLVWPWHRHEDLFKISFLKLLGTNYSNAHKYGVDV